MRIVAPQKRRGPHILLGRVFGGHEMKIAAVAFVLALASVPAKAEPALTGAALLGLCEGGSIQQAQCDGYLRGVSNTLDFIGSGVPAAGIAQGCVPQDAPALKLRSIMIKMLHRPEIHKSAPAASLAMTAFSAAFRCNPSGPYRDAEERLGRAIR